MASTVLPPPVLDFLVKNASSETMMTEVSRFHAVDYVIFVIMLCVSVGIGFFYACTGTKQKTASEYLVANRSMGKFPITLSLIASFMSSIAMLGMPSETYTYGVGYMFNFLGLFFALPVAGWVFLPMFYDLQLTSTIEYVERRFNRRLRYMASTLFIIAMTMYAAFVIYGPAISLRQVTGMNIWGSIATIGLVGTFYTSVGGIKAVMWTDVVQIMLMILALLVICIKGTIDVGGWSHLVATNLEGGRLEPPSFSLDPRIRYTMWGCTISPFMMWCTVYGAYQTQVQRYLSAPTKLDAQKSLLWNIPGLTLVYVLCSYIGFILYTKYHGCDPLTSEQLDAPDQIAPLFVMETMSNIPGLPGLYVAGVFSGALSTVSSVFNSLAAVVLEDFVKQTKRWKDITEEEAAKASKLIALSFGLLSLLLASLGDLLGSVLQSSQYNISVFTATYFGIFLLGMFFPWATSKGTTIGAVVGFVLGLWLSIGSQTMTYKPPRPPISIDQCSEAMYNASLENYQETVYRDENDGTLEFYKLSYVWLPPFVTVSVVITGLIASFVTGANNPDDVDPRYITSITKFLIKTFRKSSPKQESLNCSKENGSIPLMTDHRNGKVLTDDNQDSLLETKLSVGSKEEMKYIVGTVEIEKAWDSEAGSEERTV